MTRKSWNVYMTLRRDQRSHGKAERSWTETARPTIVFTLGFNLIFGTLGTGWHELRISWVANHLQERKETKQSQVFTRVGCGLARVWIGLELDPSFCVCCSLDAVWQDKEDKVGRQQVDSLAASQPGLTTVSAWQSDSLDVQQLQLGFWTAWQLGS